MLFTPDPIAFTIFGLEIRWYAILICIGMLVAISIAYYKAPKFGINSEDLMDIILVSFPISIIGLRVWYVLFNLDYYHSFYDVINLRAGGLAIHGGLIFGLSAAYFMCRRKKVSFLNAFDLAVPCIALGQAIGRWGNFFNQEAYGTPTNLPWAIEVNGVNVHPTFLYESIWCLLLFIGLSIFTKKRTFSGQIFCLYIILYSIERFFVEQLRVDSLLWGSGEKVKELFNVELDPSYISGVLHIGKFLIYPFRTAQFISLIGIIGGIIFYKYLVKKNSDTKSISGNNGMEIENFNSEDMENIKNNKNNEDIEDIESINSTESINGIDDIKDIKSIESIENKSEERN